MSLRDELEKWIRPVKKRIANLLLKGILENVNTSSAYQVCKVYLQRDEIQNNVERIQEYGFTSIPEDGAQVLLGCLNGDRNQSIVLCVGDSRYKVTGSEGDVILHSKGNNKVHLKADGDILIEVQSGKNINLGAVGKQLINSLAKTLYNSHVHLGGTISGSTDVPTVKWTDSVLTEKTKAE